MAKILAVHSDKINQAMMNERLMNLKILQLSKMHLLYPSIEVEKALSLEYAKWIDHSVSHWMIQYVTEKYYHLNFSSTKSYS